MEIESGNKFRVPYLSFIWTSREKKTCSFGDEATNSEANSVRYVRFFSIFSSGRLIEAFVLPRIVQNIAIFSVEIGGWAFIRAWASIRDFTVFKFGIDLSYSKRKIRNFIFIREISDFPWQHFHNGKIPSPDYFWALNFYFGADFHYFCRTFLRLLKCRRMKRSDL